MARLAQRGNLYHSEPRERPGMKPRRMSVETVHQSKSHIKSALITGSILALALSIIQSLQFRSEFQSPTWLIPRYSVSLIVGACFVSIGGILLDLVPIRSVRIVEILADAFFAGYSK
jgi:hypothetical protein